MENAQKLPIIPTTMGFNVHKGKHQEMNLTNFGMGQSQALAFGQGLKNAIASKINLQNNRIAPESALAILENINDKVKELNLSDNALHDGERARLMKIEKF